MALEPRYLLDSSAILALIENEEGADRVQAVLREADSLLPWLVLMEDEPTLLTAARFKAEHRLSFADAVIAAYARRRDAILLHKDPEYEALIDEVEMESLPYKTPQKP